MTQKTSFFPLGGGMDLVTPEIAKPPGRVVAALNYEPVASGYKRLTGYERFDGRTAPSAATYWRIDYTAGDNNGTAPTVGQNIRDSTASGNQHIIGFIVAVVTTSGSWATDDAAGYFIATNMTADLTGTTGYFSISPSPLRSFSCTTQTLEYDFGAAQNEAYRAAAAEVARSKILAITGSGPVRGVWYFNGEVLALRDDAGGTQGVMYKATSSGWSVIPNLTRIDFTVDTATQSLPTNKAPSNEIANVASGTSDGTIQVVAIDNTVGTVSTGHMLISGYVAGSFTAGGQTIYLAGSATEYGETTAAASSATIAAGGRYFFVNHNFYGADDYGAVYMVNGTGQALVYDGTGFANIDTGMDVDTPTRIAVHRDSLFLGFPGGSLQFSSPGEPLVFDPIVGAGEIGIGDEIVDLIPANGGALAILGENSVSILYGYDSTDYQLEVLTRDAGALAFSAQRIGDVLYLDNVGIRKLSTTAAFGNFQLSAISRLITPLLEDLHHDGVLPIASFSLRHRDQYWLIFDSGVGIVMLLSKKDPEILPINLAIDLTCAHAAEINGDERVFFGDDDGYVYELDKGTSFDGDPIEHYLRLPFNHFGSPQIVKRAHKVVIDLQASGTTTLSVSVDLDKGAVEGIPAQELTVTTGGGAIDDLGSNEAYYASQIQTIAEAYLDGLGQTMSLKIAGETDDENYHTLTGVTFYITPMELSR